MFIFAKDIPGKCEGGAAGAALIKQSLQIYACERTHISSCPLAYCTKYNIVGGSCRLGAERNIHIIQG